MKRALLLIAVAVALLSACQTGTTDTKKEKVFIYNSLWQRQTAIEAQFNAREIIAETAEEYIAKYNLTSQDQLFIYDHEIPVEQAPEATAYICANDGTNKLLYVYEKVPRSDFITYADLWKSQAYAMAGYLFIDHCPEYKPPVVDTRTDYEKYALYIVKVADGSIYFETHCEDWQTGGYATIADYFNWYVIAAKGQINSMGYQDYLLITGQIYTPPTQGSPVK